MDAKLGNMKATAAILTMLVGVLVLAVPNRAGAVIPRRRGVRGAFKLVDRADGVLVENPYAFEACVGGTGITAATVSVPVTPTPRVETLVDEGFGDFCMFQQYASQGELDAAFPDGDYVFDITTTEGSDGKTINFAETWPNAYLEVTAPLDGATDVPDDVDLDVTWSLTQRLMCSVGVDCGDGIAFFLIDRDQDIDVVEELLPITDTGMTVSSAVLAPDTIYELELETYNGTVDLSGTQMTDGGDPIELVAIWEDINVTSFTTVPEPGAVLLQLSAFATLAALARRRRRLR